MINYLPISNLQLSIEYYNPSISRPIKNNGNCDFEINQLIRLLMKLNV